MSSSLTRWGIFGTGFIAGEFARGLKALPKAQLLGISSRNPANAQTFAQIFQVPKVYDSYEQLVKDPAIDVVYIATPNHTHKDLCLLCLQAGKPVLCEKPFALNAQEAREIIDVARRQQLFCMEAMWMRFMPLINKVKQLIEDGVIGEVKMLTAEFGYPIAYDPKSRFFQPQYGGGALLDRGVYGLSLAYYLFGKPSAITSQAIFAPSGIDEQSSMLLNYDSGKLAILSQSLSTYSSNQAIIMGTTGKIIIHQLFIKPEKISVIKFARLTQSYPSGIVAPSFKQKLMATVKQNPLVRRLYIRLSGLIQADKVTDIVQILEGNGYNYEAIEVMNCLQTGKLESVTMPLDETLAIMETVEQIMSQWQQ